MQCILEADLYLPVFPLPPCLSFTSLSFPYLHVFPDLPVFPLPRYRSDVQRVRFEDTVQIRTFYKTDSLGDMSSAVRKKMGEVRDMNHSSDSDSTSSPSPPPKTGPPLFREDSPASDVSEGVRNAAHLLIGLSTEPLNPVQEARATDVPFYQRAPKPVIRRTYGNQGRRRSASAERPPLSELDGGIDTAGGEGGSRADRDKAQSHGPEHVIAPRSGKKTAGKIAQRSAPRGKSTNPSSTSGLPTSSAKAAKPLISSPPKQPKAGKRKRTTEETETEDAADSHAEAPPSAKRNKGGRPRNIAPGAPAPKRT